jgi:hypothetical protein
MAKIRPKTSPKTSQRLRLPAEGHHGTPLGQQGRD